MAVNGTALPFNGTCENGTCDPCDKLKTYGDGDVRTSIDELVIEKILQRIFSTIGILGNILNLIVLNHRTVSKTVSPRSRPSHLGLILLAMSDLTICIIVLIHSTVDNLALCGPNCSSYGVFRVWFSWFYYFPLKTFIMTSTWLTVVLSWGRYLAICHPLQRRGGITVRGMWISAVAILLLSAALQLPHLLRHRTVYVNSTTTTTEGVNCTRELYKFDPFLPMEHETVYYIVRFIVTVCVPFAIQVFCTVCLIRALRESRQIQSSSSRRQTSSGHRITTTLVVLAIAFIVLVAPSSCLNFFFFEQFPALRVYMRSLFLFEIINFSLNFIIYFVLNVHFRKTVKEIFCSRCQTADGNNVELNPLKGGDPHTEVTHFPHESPDLNVNSH